MATCRGTGLAGCPARMCRFLSGTQQQPERNEFHRDDATAAAPNTSDGWPGTAFPTFRRGSEVFVDTANCFHTAPGTAHSDKNGKGALHSCKPAQRQARAAQYPSVPLADPRRYPPRHGSGTKQAQAPLHHPQLGLRQQSYGVLLYVRPRPSRMHVEQASRADRL